AAVAATADLTFASDSLQGVMAISSPMVRKKYLNFILQIDIEENCFCPASESKQIYCQSKINGMTNIIKHYMLQYTHLFLPHPF
ncbi:MAG: hypothetical protein PVF85_09280, partial [Anaerolineales bacterium]